MIDVIDYCRACGGTPLSDREEIKRLRDRLTEVYAEIDNRHSEYCEQMRGPVGEQWRERDRPCTCWVGDVMESKP